VVQPCPATAPPDIATLTGLEGIWKDTGGGAEGDDGRVLRSDNRGELAIGNPKCGDESKRGDDGGGVIDLWTAVETCETGAATLAYASNGLTAG